MKKTKKIKIILNGKSRSLQKTISVHYLIRSLKLSTDKVAIELNKEIINNPIEVIEIPTIPRAVIFSLIINKLTIAIIRQEPPLAIG